MQSFEIQLNGPLAILDLQQDNITPSSEKGKALLLLIATAGKQGRSRAWLQSILWPKASSATNLRNELSVLRRHFKRFGANPITSSKKMVLLNYELCKVDYFDKQIGARHQELAEGLDVGVPEFEEWLTQERQFWKTSFESANEILVSKPNISTSRCHKGVPLICVSRATDDASNARHELVLFGLFEEILTSLGTLVGLVDVSAIEPQVRNSDTYQIMISVRGEERLRITTRLISLFSQRIIWTSRFDLIDKQIFDVQERISRNVIEAIQEKLTDGAWAKIWRQKNTTMEAWEAFQRGRIHEAKFNKSSNLQAIAAYECALKFDSKYSPASIAKGFCLSDQIRLGWAQNIEKCLLSIEEIVAGVLELEPEDTYAQALHAFAIFIGESKEIGLELLEDIVRSNPSSPELVAYLGAMLGHAGQLESEIYKYKQSLFLTTYPPVWIISNLAIAQATLGDVETGETADKALQRAPNSVRARIAKICWLISQCRVQEAKCCANEIRTIEPNFNAATWSHKDCFTRVSDFEKIELQLSLAGL